MALVASVLIEPLQKLLEYFQKDRHVRDDKKDAALLAIQAAIIQTEHYIEESGGAKCFNRNQEYELAQLWAEAAVRIRYASPEMAARLHDKADYWADQLAWSADEVVRREIDLRSIKRTVKELLAR